MSDIAARPALFSIWGDSAHRARFDYVASDRGLVDILNARYFRTVANMIKVNDQITIIDKVGDEVVVRISYIDHELQEVGLAIVERVVARPANGSLDLQFVGGKGPGSRYVIVNQDGQRISGEIMGRKTAEREMQALLQSEAA